jgi:hypothetical protein
LSVKKWKDNRNMIEKADVKLNGHFHFLQKNEGARISKKYLLLNKHEVNLICSPNVFKYFFYSEIILKKNRGKNLSKNKIYLNP